MGLNYLDLFSGIGGFALGAYRAGWRFDKHYFSEVDEYAIKVYRRRFPDAVPLGDITKIDTAELLADTGWNGPSQTEQDENDKAKGEWGNALQPGTQGRSTTDWIFSGGFPCQDISVAGKGEGIGGSRSGLWFEMWRIIRDLRPRFVIAENVGAITFRGLDRVLSSLAEIGYDAEWQDIRASDMGAPHRRERIWIVAYPNGERESAMPVDGDSRCGELGQDVADTIGERRTGRADDKAGGNVRRRNASPGCCAPADAWPPESDVGRMAYGIPSRVDRLKCLGNAIVPQIAEILFRQIGV